MDDMKKMNENHSRSNFLKKTSLVFLSIFGFSILGFNIYKRLFSQNTYKFLSNKEAIEIIRKMPSLKFKKIKAEPPPKS